MVFCANSAVVMKDKALIAGMSAEPRQQESEPFAAWFRSNGFEVKEMDKMVSCGYITCGPCILLINVV